MESPRARGAGPGEGRDKYPSGHGAPLGGGGLQNSEGIKEIGSTILFPQPQPLISPGS